MRWDEPNRPLIPDEHTEQKFVIQELRLRFPVMAKHIAAVPNGQMRDRRVAKRLKEEGVSPGYPDLLLDYPRGPFHGFRCEMKRIDATPSKWLKHQREWAARLNEVGFLSVVALGRASAIDQFERYWDLGEFDQRKVVSLHRFNVQWPIRQMRGPRVRLSN